MASRPSGVKAPGKYKLMFANVDCRLRVWVDGRAVDFGADADYRPVEAEIRNGSPKGWTDQNDREPPASVGASGGVAVSHLVLSRDVYYTRQNTNLEFEPGRADDLLRAAGALPVPGRQQPAAPTAGRGARCRSG